MNNDHDHPDANLDRHGRPHRSAYFSDLGPPKTLEDLPPAFFTIECRCPDTGQVLRMTNAPSRLDRRRLERQQRKRMRRLRSARKP